MITYKGLLIGLCAFLTIGLFHPLVIKMEYYVGRKVWWSFMLAAAICAGFSIFTSSYLSLFLGVIAASLFWAGLEMNWQHDRACKGQAKRNPNRPPEYYSLSKKSEGSGK